jgi:hypothetical protein
MNFFCQTFGQKKIIEYSNMEYGVFDSSGTKMECKVSKEAMDAAYRRELDSMVQNNLDTVCIDYEQNQDEEWNGLSTKKIYSISWGILCKDTSDNSIVVIPKK